MCKQCEKLRKLPAKEWVNALRPVMLLGLSAPWVSDALRGLEHVKGVEFAKATAAETLRSIADIIDAGGLDQVKKAKRVGKKVEGDIEAHVAQVLKKLEGEGNGG